MHNYKDYQNNFTYPTTTKPFRRKTFEKWEATDVSFNKHERDDNLLMQE